MSTNVYKFMTSGVWSEQPKVTVVDGGNAEYVCYASGNTDVMKATLNYPGDPQATVRVFDFVFSFCFVFWDGCLETLCRQS